MSMTSVRVRVGLVRQGMAGTTLAADTVASLLRDPATQAATLNVLEHHEAVIDRRVALAAALALYELLASDATEICRDD